MVSSRGILPRRITARQQKRKGLTKAGKRGIHFPANLISAIIVSALAISIGTALLPSSCAEGISTPTSAVTSASPMLTITNFRVTPTSLRLGETFTVSGRVANAGLEPVYHVSVGTSISNIGGDGNDFWYPQDVTAGPRSAYELAPGEALSFNISMRATTATDFDIGVYAVYTGSLDNPTGTKVDYPSTVRVGVANLPPLVPGWLIWLTAAIFAAGAALVGWRLKWLWALRREWRASVLTALTVVAVGLIVYGVLVSPNFWTWAMIFVFPAIGILQGLATRKAVVSLVAPAVPAFVVSSAAEMLHLLAHYYPLGGLMLPFTLLALLPGLMGFGAASWKRGKAYGMVVLALGLILWLGLWFRALFSG